MLISNIHSKEHSHSAFSEDDLWEYLDLDAKAHIGELVEYKTSVLYHGEWIESEWNKGWYRSTRLINNLSTMSTTVFLKQSFVLNAMVAYFCFLRSRS